MFAVLCVPIAGLIPQFLPFRECSYPLLGLFFRLDPTAFILCDELHHPWMIGHLRSEILQVFDIDHTGDEASGLAVEANGDHAVARSCIAASDVDLRASPKLACANFRLCAAWAVRM